MTDRNAEFGEILKPLKSLFFTDSQPMQLDERNKFVQLWTTTEGLCLSWQNISSHPFRTEINLFLLNATIPNHGIREIAQFLIGH